MKEEPRKCSDHGGKARMCKRTFKKIKISNDLKLHKV